MPHRIHIRKAPTLRDLLDQVDAAVDGPGKDAPWIEREGGRVYTLGKQRNEDLSIESKARYLYETARTEVTGWLRRNRT